MPNISGLPNSLDDTTLADADVLVVDDTDAVETKKTTVGDLKTLIRSGLAASGISFTPDGDIAASTVQAAIVEARDDTDTKLAAKAPDFRTPVIETTTARTLTDADHGKQIWCSHASGCSITVDASTLTPGFECDVIATVGGGGASINAGSTGTATAPAAATGSSILAGSAMSIGVARNSPAEYTVQGPLV